MEDVVDDAEEPPFAEGAGGEYRLGGVVETPPGRVADRFAERNAVEILVATE